MESFDSLWFYGNVLASTRRRSTGHQPLLDATEIQAKDEHKSGCELGISQPVMIAKPVIDVQTEKPKEKKRRRKTRSNDGRKIFAELDYLLGFESKVSYSGSWMLMEEKLCGFGGQNDHVKKMPPLKDGMAMKEHIKSWAHAVACTVR